MASTVAIAMSGGVDSSVAALLLKRQGFKVIGLHLSFWKDPTVFSDEDLRSFPQNRCCSIASLEDGRRVAAAIDIPFYVLNTREKFKERIVDYYVAGYAAGETPNPCVKCNREMKFGALLDRVHELGADFLASGHYARITHDSDGYHLRRAKDLMKDQSYFLYHLGQEKLRSVMFPLGDYVKEEVYAIATEAKLPLPEKKESQGICFIPDKKNMNFLKRHMAPAALQPGPIRDVDGTVYAEQHQGLPLYTIGQREGITIGGAPEPLYVVGFDVPVNTLIVGRNDDVFARTLRIRDISFTRGKPPEGADIGEAHVEAMIRYRFAPRSATLSVQGMTGSVVFEEPVRAVTPGQTIVLYRGDEVIGGGTITR